MTAPTATFPTAHDALTYRHDYDVRMKALYRKTMPTLHDIERAHLAGQGMTRLSGGPSTKEELISTILDAEYSRDKLNEAIHVAYHSPGESWSACEHCHPHEGQRCECSLRCAS